MKNEDFYSLSARSISKKDVNFSDFRNKVVLVVNTASKCGFTPQFTGLEELYKKHSEKGLEILGFPCNQFAGQEPGDEESIKGGCLLNYGVTFPMFAKVKVNGRETHPVYTWLKSHFPGGLFGSRRIKWNFTKFLLDRQGRPVKRYSPSTTPEDIEKDILRLFED